MVLGPLNFAIWAITYFTSELQKTSFTFAIQKNTKPNEKIEYPDAVGVICECL